MNRSNTLGWFTAVMILSMAHAPAARAFCTNSRFWPNKDIPVWVVTDSMTHLNLPTGTALEYIKAAMEQINSSSGADRRLYYAGVASNDNHGVDGITVYTSCGKICAPGWAACTYADPPDVKIGIRRSDCSEDAVTWSTNFVGQDLQVAMAHEFGHALGLNHSDLTDPCTNPSPTASKAVMSRGIPTGPVRWLRRDDIEGLRYKYGARDRQMYSRSSTDGRTWAAEQAMSNNPPVRTAVSATTSQGPSDEYMAITWADDWDVVRGRERSWTGWSDAITPDPGSTGVTYDTPAVAQDYIHGRTLYAWIANETTTSFNVQVRWAIHDRVANTWYRRTGPTTFAKSIGAGYDPVSNKFLVSYMDSGNPPTWHMLTIFTSAVPKNDTDTNKKYHEVGQSVCDAAGRCVTAIATTGNAPCLGWLDGAIGEGGIYLLNDEVLDCYASHGATDLAGDMSASARGFVGSFINAGTISRVYLMTSVGTLITALTKMDTQYTSIGVGSMNRQGQVAFQAFYAR